MTHDIKTDIRRNPDEEKIYYHDHQVEGGEANFSPNEPPVESQAHIKKEVQRKTSLHHLPKIFGKKFEIQRMGLSKIILRDEEKRPYATFLRDPEGMIFLNVVGLMNLYLYRKKYTENTMHSWRIELHSRLGAWDICSRR